MGEDENNAFSPDFLKSILYLNLFRTFRVFMADASQKRKDNEY